ncbi:recombinase family protein [Actinomycetaceae bacterium MB13-C1-2]|nr:recombinase family protein [Actinomycetaceae bacterium MB13-C1-2]
MIPYCSLLGFKNGAEGGIAVHEEQAAVVRRIYAGYLSEHSLARIARELTAESIPTPEVKQRGPPRSAPSSPRPTD